MPAPFLIGDERAFADFLTNANAAPDVAAGLVGLQTSSVAATAGLNTTETVLDTFPLIAGSTFKVGSRVRMVAQGTCTSTNADVSTFTIRAGTAGTTADASVATATVTSAGSGSAVPFKAVLEWTVRTLGAAGTASGSLEFINNGTTGAAAAAVTVVAFTSSTLATTTATVLSLTYVSAAVTTTCTFQNVSIEVLS